MNVGRCQPLMEAPLVLFGRDGYVIDGSLIRLDSELIAALGNKVDLWKQINPGKSFPGRLVAVASGETLARALVLAHLHDLGFHHIQLVTHMPRRRVATATVGTVDLGSTCCGVEVELDSEGVHLALDTTYADLVRVAREARERHSVLRIAR
jgi:hypothetical protein